MTEAKRYTMTFTGAMPYANAVPPGFWSLTMYDKTTNYSAPDSINRYSLGSMRNLKKNDDGSFMLYLRPIIQAQTRNPTGCRHQRDRSI